MDTGQWKSGHLDVLKLTLAFSLWYSWSVESGKIEGKKRIKIFFSSKASFGLFLPTFWVNRTQTMSFTELTYDKQIFSNNFWSVIRVNTIEIPFLGQCG